MVKIYTNHNEQSNSGFWLSDETLFFNQLRTHDAKAFKNLYQLYAAALYGSILRTLPDALNAEHILEQTFFEAWSNITTFDESKSKIFTWLNKIAKAQCSKFA
ncbi:sigma factor [Pedobacter nototheniae]|uniref:sigma factor n=1 Tax=Pedobacter nototheniae TaxID=2488994 RepID=UPI00292F3A62|nr:sigma factor [Pedobacter nototheniae]